MFLRGKPHVPPGCPANKHPEAEIDVATADFEITLAPFTPQDAQGRQQVEIFAAFTKPDDDPEAETQEIGTESIEVWSDDALVRATEIVAEDEDKVEQLRQKLCDRIATCRGVVGGECWALSALALEDVIVEIAEQ